MRPIRYLLLLVALTASGLQGCLRDHCSQTSQYHIYTPVFTSMADIRASLRSEAPRAIVHPGKIFYHKGYLFLGELNEGVHVIDDRDPAAPRALSFIRIPGNLDLTLRGDVLYADSYGDLVALDISDPLQAQVLDREEDVFSARMYAYGFADKPDTRGVITGFTSRDTIVLRECNLPDSWGKAYYDAVSNEVYLSSSDAMAAPSVGPSPASVGGSLARFTTLDHYLYTITPSHADLGIFDIADPADPVQKGELQVGWNIETLFPYGQQLFIGSSSGVFIYDASDPAQPTRLGQFLHVTGCDPVVVQGHYAYVTVRDGTNCRSASAINELSILDVSTMTHPVALRSMALTNPRGLAVDGNRLMVCDGPGGLRFIDISDKRNPRLVTTLPVAETYDAIALNGILVVVAKDGLYQYDYSEFSRPRLLARLGIADS